MIPKLALLSGKGGSGKTTIALSLSKMLSECGLKVLLVDCDIATNGATYFFESRLVNKSEILSLQDFFDNHDNNKDNMLIERILKVSNNFWFVPSNLSFPNNFLLVPSNILIEHEDDNKKPYSDTKLLNNFARNIANYENDFDVMLFDCQAGYSKILDSILKISITNLIVLEPDAISSSAMRVLYAQVSALIEKGKTYQIFSKITDEEYLTYSRIATGTMFNSLPPIKFNWEVRKAFAYAQVPEMVSTNVEFGKDVHELSKVLFKQYEEALSAYTRKILIQDKENLELELEMLEAEKIERKRQIYKLLFAPISIIFGGVLLFSIFDIFASIVKFTYNKYNSVFALTVIIAIALFGYFVNKQEESYTEYKNKHSTLTKRIAEIDIAIDKHENMGVDKNYW